MEHEPFLSELERCILANSSSPPEITQTKYSSSELAEMYLNGEFNLINEEEFDEHGYSEVDEDEEGYNEDEDMLQIIYIDDSNFSKLDPDQIKDFINHLTTILGVSPYSEDEVSKFINQRKKPKE